MNCSILGNALKHDRTSGLFGAPRYMFTLLLGAAILLGLFALVGVSFYTGQAVVAEVRIRNAVNLLQQERLTAQRHQAMSDIENAGERAVPALVAALHSENVVMRRNAAEMLGFIPSSQSIAALRAAASSDPMPQVRQSATRALGEIGDGP